jgi:hypothetical protein
MSLSELKNKNMEIRVFGYRKSGFGSNKKTNIAML